MSDRYHYTACGLDYVYLLNGYTPHETAYGKGVAIDDARQLHQVIAREIIGRRAPLRGMEVKFLRSMLKCSQESLATVLRQSRGSVARWEGAPNDDIPGAADTALRLFYALKEEGPELARKVSVLLEELDERVHEEMDSHDATFGRKDSKHPWVKQRELVAA